MSIYSIHMIKHERVNQILNYVNYRSRKATEM